MKKALITFLAVCLFCMPAIASAQLKANSGIGITTIGGQQHVGFWGNARCTASECTEVDVVTGLYLSFSSLPSYQNDNFCYSIACANAAAYVPYTLDYNRSITTGTFYVSGGYIGQVSDTAYL